MRSVPRYFLALGIVILALACGSSKNAVNPKLSDEMPMTILWVWERPENLRFIDPAKVGVAFLAQTLVLEKDEIIYKPRRQPLDVEPGTFLIAVTRIETLKLAGSRPSMSPGQVSRIVSLVRSTLELPNVRAVQIDFDAVGSERKFYGQFMRELSSNCRTAFLLR
ncbi:MAG TPA: hypothetical protein VK468_08585 [Pyrinomonadaceae bacterium]|nr:hypothetical protein [Pyrinomonadaceae bacterium]